jgi:hypothetical protein
MAQVTLQDIFQASFPDYERTHPLPWHGRRAAYAIMHGRTAVLGGHVQSCPDGHVSRIWPIRTGRASFAMAATEGSLIQARTSGGCGC